MELQTCGTCRCAVKREGDEQFLECHRHPIAIIGFDRDGEAVSAFPVTEPNEWCYEFVPREI